MKLIKLFTFVLALSCAGSLHAARTNLLYVESSQPDLSNDFLNPTQLFLEGNASNLMILRIGDEIEDPTDYFQIHVPTGHKLSAIRLLSFDSVFTNIASGLSNCAIGDDCLFGSQLQDVALHQNRILDELLPGITPYSGLTNFYMLSEFQDKASVTLDFVTTPVPEPFHRCFRPGRAWDGRSTGMAQEEIAVS